MGTIIANPIYDIVFERLMENDRIAKFFIGTLLGKDIEVVDLKPQEVIHTVDNRSSIISISVLRVAFIATIKSKDGAYKKILIEILKARKSIDLRRFRVYLGNQYGREYLIDGKTTSLPVITIYVLGFNLPEINTACLKVGRKYVDLIEQTVITKIDPFIEALDHDCYVIQARRITPSYQTALGRLLSLFEQNNFIGNSDIAKGYDNEPDDENIKMIIDILQNIVCNSEERKNIENDQEAWRTFIAMFSDADRESLQKLEEIEIKLAHIHAREAALKREDALLAEIAALKKQQNN